LPALLAFSALATPACTTSAANEAPLAPDDAETLGTSQAAWNVVAPPLPGFPPNPVKPQSFLLATSWTPDMTSDDGWGPSYPRLLADVDGDGRKDIVGFGIAGAWVGRSTGSSFLAQYALAEYGADQGWTTSKHVRLVGDVTGDGRDDLVGFANDGVYLAASNGTGFGAARLVVADFGYDSGWRVESHTRLLADVDGDGRKDIVAYGRDGVWIARSTGTGFRAPSFVLASFGTAQSFTPARHVRTAADVNGDGRDDLVVFADDGVYTALSTGAGFLTPTRAVAEMGYSQSWRVDKHPRFLVDVNGDYKKDIIGFGDAGVYVARSTATGFGPATFEVPHFGTQQGFTSADANPRAVVDLNGDGYLDLVGVGPWSVWRSLGGPNGFGAATSVLNDLSRHDGIGGASTPLLFGDVDADGKADLVGFTSAAVRVARSTDAPLSQGPIGPANLSTADISDSSVRLTWTHPSTDELRFHIQYRKQGTAQYTNVFRPANTTSYSVTGLSASTTYCFRVGAQDAFVSTYTAETCATTRASSSGGGGGGGGGTSGSTLECGTGPNACGSDFHPEGYEFSASCPGSPPTDNASKCVTNSSSLGVFTMCGLNACPIGFHPVEFLFSAPCDLSSSGPTVNDNATTCQRDTSSFIACGNCPRGYTRTQIASSLRCKPYDTYQCTL